ncbi:Tim44/TimA family putative adaptor protein [Marinivivus vitaminiproducens]|uniref:Tim44/TimA family putative adaptor protein n=1 Tax=Marinivivus vitaminiproducens TaxID=3035935 RepID=UPI0027A88086|nr:Tim44/TimA family putative adaptor protein [Geminicoccaceae bacterium SCSIO 64248]
MDILFFAMVAAFIALRLRSVLGRRTGHERRRSSGLGTAADKPTSDNVVVLPERGKSAMAEETGIADVTDPSIKTGLADVRLADPRFELAEFLEGARAAFAMIVDAFAQADKDTLRPLLAGSVYANFAQAIDDRLAAGNSLQTELVGIRQSELTGAALDGRIARLTVRFVSEQAHTLRDPGGAVVAAGTHPPEEVVDIWTFERDVGSQDPNWALAETRAPE